ncbi:organic cation transporter protein-like [Littorina saxatilis]|uniref:organic cation transporter protein-like n=1 Tax=Littorina saxatilis TaxID=31220 RepID=UPI0038B5D14A
MTVDVSKDEKKPTWCYEDVVEHLGGFGRYQQRVFFLMCLPVMSLGIQTLMTVFSMKTPQHRCAVPGVQNDSYDLKGIEHERLLNISIPWVSANDVDNKVMRSQCLLYRNRNQTVYEEGLLYSNRSTTSCSKWVFDHSTFTNTFTEEAAFVCDKREYHAFADMLFMVGKLIGSFLVGIFSDFFGRKTGFVFSMVLHIGCAVGGAFVQSFTVYVALRFIMGGANFGVFLSVYVLGLELVGRKSRTVAGQFLQISWCFGLLFLAGLAYGLRDWRHLQLAVSCPTVLFLGYYWFIEESPRWLISKGRYDEANAILRKVAHMNGQPAPPTLEPSDSDVSVKKESALRMFTNKTTLVRTLIIFINWIVCTMIYYGLSLNVGNIGGNVYLNFTLSTVAEFIGYVIAMAGLDRLGRKAMHCGSMIVGGLALIASMFPVMYGGDSVTWSVILLSNIGKMGASSAFSIIYLFSAELFPTVARNSLVGMSSMVARVGGVISPYIAQLNVIVGGHLGVALPLVVFGGLALFAGLLALWLPETLHRPLPETMEDARNFGKLRSDSVSKKISSSENGASHNEKIA